MKEIDRLQEEYEREKFLMKINQVIDRKISHFRGMEKTRRHNEEQRRKQRIREEMKDVKVTKPVLTKRKMKKSVGLNVTTVTWTPSTTKEDIEKKLKLKGKKLKSRIRPTTKMVTSRKGRPPKEVVILFLKCVTLLCDPVCFEKQ